MILRIILAACALASVACMSSGRLQFSGDLAPLGIPAQFTYDSGKNPHPSK